MLFNQTLNMNVRRCRKREDYKSVFVGISVCCVTHLASVRWQVCSTTDCTLYKLHLWPLYTRYEDWYRSWNGGVARSSFICHLVETDSIEITPFCKKKTDLIFSKISIHLNMMVGGVFLTSKLNGAINCL